MTANKVNNYFLSAFAAVVLLTSRILHPYGFQGTLSFDQITFDLVILFTLFIKGLRNNISKWLWMYFIYRYFNHLYYARSLTAIVYPSLWISLLYFIVFFEDINLKQFIKFYKILALIIIIFFYLQEFTYFTTGYRISGLMPGLPIYLEGVEDAKTFVREQTYANRSSSFFSEPAALVQFLIPLLAIFLFDKKQSNRYFWIGLLGFTLLMTRSGNALLGLLVIFIIFVFKILQKSSIIIKIIYIFSILIFGSIALKIYINSEIGEDLIERKEEITEIDEKSSGFFRIFRGYFVYDDYSPNEKIFGIDDIILIEKITDSSIVATDSHVNLYFNVIQSILLRTGIIGLSIFLMFLRSLWIKNSVTGRAILLCFFAYMFLTSHYFTSTMIFYLTLSYKYQQKEKSKLSNLSLRNSK